MYLLFRLHDKFPLEYYTRRPGEKKVIRAFMRKEVDDRNAENDEIAGD